MSGGDTQLTYVGRPEPEPYIMGPRSMLELNPARPLSIAARLVMFYLCDLAGRPGWTIYVAHVIRVLGITNCVWVRVRRELEAAGHYRAEKLRDPNTGRWVWRHYVYRDPITPPPPLGKAVPSRAPLLSKESTRPKSMDGTSINGCEGDIRSNTSLIPTERSSMNVSAPTRHAAANDQQTHPRKKARRERPSGIVCWYGEDHESAQQIEVAHSPTEVSDAVAAIRLAGKDPVPGLVKKEIQRAQTLHEKAAKAKEREDSGPLAEARRRRAERERREADPVAREAGLEAARKAAMKLKM